MPNEARKYLEKGALGWAGVGGAQTFQSAPHLGSQALVWWACGGWRGGSRGGAGRGGGVDPPREGSSLNPSPRFLQGFPGKTGPRGGVVSPSVPFHVCRCPARGASGPSTPPLPPHLTRRSLSAGRPGGGRPPWRERREGDRAAQGRAGRGDWVSGPHYFLTGLSYACRASLASRGPRDR